MKATWTPLDFQVFWCTQMGGLLLSPLLLEKSAFSHSVLIYIRSDFQMPKPSLLILLSGHTYERSAIAKWLEALRNFDSIRSWEEGNVDRETESQLNLYEKRIKTRCTMCSQPQFNSPVKAQPLKQWSIRHIVAYVYIHDIETDGIGWIGVCRSIYPFQGENDDLILN